MSKLSLLVLGMAWGAGATAQTSSLVLSAEGDTRAERYEERYAVSADATPLHPAVRVWSDTAVPLPPPVEYAEGDLVTIVIRESMQSDFDSELETSVGADFDSSINAFPRLSLSDLIDLQLTPNNLTTPVQLDVTSDRDWSGEGEFSTSDSVTGRITARVLEVLPNGTLVLEARKYLEVDGQSLDVVLLGTCRVDDITAENTVLSTQMYDLYLIKEHAGELRESTRKGWISRVLEAIFDF